MSPDLVGVALPLALMSKAVAVWQADLDRLPAAAVEVSLSAAEQQRASRFAFDVHRRRFMAGRHFLREVLASHIHCEPAEIRLVAGAQGKPAAADHAELHFNLAHSEAIALLAVAPRAIGVDVELLRPLADADLLAERLYTARERDWIDAAIGDDERALRFLQCWTRKEACLKAIGCGLAIEPSSFDVVAGFGRAPVVVLWNGRRYALSLHELRDDSDRWVAAVALVDAVTAERAEHGKRPAALQLG